MNRFSRQHHAPLSALRSFSYAFDGIVACIREERHFRFHLAVTFHLFAYMRFFALTRAEVCVLVSLCGLVISLEAVNSAIERAVDSTGIVSPTAGAAKDIAAGAVLIAAITSVICGVIMLWQPHAFMAIGRFFVKYPIAVIVQLAVLGGWIWFVFFCHSGDRHRMNS